MLVNPKGNQFLVHFYFMVQTHFFEPHLISSFRKTFFMMAEKIDELFKGCIITSIEPTCLKI